MKLKHLNARVYTEKILPLHKQLFPFLNIESFCLIREPLERMKSWYCYRSRNELRNPDHQNHKNYTGNISYNEFIEAYIATGERKPFACLRTQYDFVRLESGAIGIDHIIPMERMDLVADFLFKKIRKKLSCPTKTDLVVIDPI